LATAAERAAVADFPLNIGGDKKFRVKNQGFVAAAAS
jgi:hypothetical protein